MKKGYVAIDDYEVIAAGVDEEAVKDWVFDYFLKNYDQTEIDEILEDLDYLYLEDLRVDAVYRGYTDLWEYLEIDFDEVPIIGVD